MTVPDKIRTSLIYGIENGSAEQGVEEARRALAAGCTPIEIFNDCIVPTLKNMGDKFSRMELYLPEMMMSADAVKSIFEVLAPAVKENEKSALSRGKVVIGTVAGDVHDIGKNIVALMLEVNGFEVIDLGCDVPSNVFIKTARERKAEIIALSSLITTSLPYMKDVLAMVSGGGSGESRPKVMVGGGPVTAEWAKQYGADGYGKDATEAVETAQRLVDPGHKGR